MQVRGVSSNALEVRNNSQDRRRALVSSPALPKLVVGRNVQALYTGLTLGIPFDLAAAHWNVVGVFDAGGSAFDSEVWCDAHVLNQVYNRPDNIFQSVTVHLTSPAAFQQFKDAVTADPRLNVDVMPRNRLLRQAIHAFDHADHHSRAALVAAIMAIGAIFGALNTMYSAVAERSREIATMRALGFGGPR